MVRFGDDHLDAPRPQMGQDLVAGAVAGEPAVAFPHRLPGTELRGNVPPRDPGPVPVDDSLDHLPVIAKRASPVAV